MKHAINYFLNRCALIVAQLTVRASQKDGVLLVRLDNLGDFILWLPALEGFRKLYQQEKLTLLVSTVTLDFADYVSKQGINVDELISIDRHTFAYNFFYKLKILRQCRRAGYRLAISPVFSRELIPDHIIAATGAVQRIGWKGDEANMAKALLNKTDVYYTKLVAHEGLQAEVERNNYFLQSLGGRLDDIIPHVSIPAVDEEEAERVIAELASGKFAVICPGADKTYRRWPAQRFAKVCDYLFEQGIKVIMCGSGKERELAKEVISFARQPIINLVGATPVIVLAAIIKRAALYVGNCSGPAHLSVAVGTPTVVIMGGGHFKRFFPYGDLSKNLIAYDPDMQCKNDNWVCVRRVRAGDPAPCIAGVTVENVIEKINGLLKK